MAKGAWKVTLADGTTIDGLGLNGDNLVSGSEVTEDMFRGKLSRVTIDGPGDGDDAGLRGEHGPMALVQIAKYGNDWYFILQDIKVTELGKIRGDVEYIAMMCDIEL